MARSFVCTQGHRWDDTEQASSPPAAAAPCPVCGGTGRSADGAAAVVSVADELPPPPASVSDSSGPTLSTRGEGAGAWAAAPPDQPAIPGYEILGVLGRGGMGVVYKARQQSLNRLVALKMLLGEGNLSSMALERFRGEALAIAQLQHANIVNIYDIGEQDRRPYIALEFVEGGSLAQQLAGKPMASGEAARLVATLARAMHAAHRRGIIHRDLKPANVLLTTDGLPKITDFGLAKLLPGEPGAGGPAHQTQSGAILGTPSYMAPEQAEGRTREIGPATDIYALGAILYELLAGRPPFRGKTTYHTLHQVISEEPEPPSRVRASIPSDLERICLKCLQKDPARRYATALDLVEDLVRFVTQPEGEPTHLASVAPSVPPSPALAPTIQDAIAPSNQLLPHRRSWWWTGVILSAVLLGAAVWYSIQGNPSWDVVTIATTGEKFDRLAFPTRTTGYAASREALYKTEDGGNTWKRLDSGEVGRVHLLHFQDVQTGWLGSDRLRQTRDGGKTWQTVDLDAGVSLLSLNSLAVGADGWALAGGTTRTDRQLAFFRRRGAAEPWRKLDPLETHYWGGAAQPYQKWFLGGLAILGPRQALAVLFRGTEDGGIVLHTADAGNTWTPGFKTNIDLYRVHFTDAQRGWLAGNHGSLWATRDGGVTWQAQPIPGKATISSFAFEPTGRFGLAPLWQGKVLTTTGDAWQVAEVGLGESMPSAAVVDPGCAFVLGSDGRLARYVDPRSKPGS